MAFSEEGQKLCISYCEYAVERMKEIGFILVYTSMKSEACYYGHSMKPKCLLRVAHHRFGRNEKHFSETHGKTVSNIIFSPYNIAADGVGWEAIENRIFSAVGRFFLYRGEHITRKGNGF